VAGEIFHLPAFVRADFLALCAAARAGTFSRVQLVDLSSYRKIIEVGKIAPPLAPLHASKLFLWIGARWKIVRVNRLAIHLLGEVQKHLRQITRGLQSIGARPVSRSNPHRMSVVSAASQIRVPCAPSSARKLGSPIMRPIPAPPARLADDTHRNLALPKGCAHRSGESQSLDDFPEPAFVARSTPSLSLLQTSPLHPREVAFSNRRKANPEDHGHDRMPQLSDRFDAAPIQVHATSSIIPPCAVSSNKIATSRNGTQDGVNTALTLSTGIEHTTQHIPISRANLNPRSRNNLIVLSAWDEQESFFLAE
jgi:hypothetical protein